MANPKLSRAQADAWEAFKSAPLVHVVLAPSEGTTREYRRSLGSALVALGKQGYGTDAGLLVVDDDLNVAYDVNE